MSEKCRFCCKSLFGVSAKIFQGSSCVFARGDMRGYIVSHKNRHGASHRLYRVLQWRSRLKIDFREILGPGRFPTFATKSARSGHSRAAAVEPVIPGAPGRSAGEPRIHRSAVRRPSRAARHKTAPVLCATAAGHLRASRSFIDSARRSRTTIGEATSDRRAGPRRVAATHLSRASPSGTRSRSGGAPLPRPAPWRAA